jgi:hypothetical protein
MFQFQPQQQEPVKKPWVKIQSFSAFAPCQVIFDPLAINVETDMLNSLKSAGIRVASLRTPHGYKIYVNEENYRELISSLNSAGLEVFYVL